MKKDEMGRGENSREGMRQDDGYFLDGDYEDGLGLSEGETWEDEDWEGSAGRQKKQEEKRAWQAQEEAKAAEEERRGPGRKYCARLMKPWRVQRR